MSMPVPGYTDFEFIHVDEESHILVQRARSVSNPELSVICKGVTKFDQNANTKLQMEYSILCAIHSKLKLYEERVGNPEDFLLSQQGQYSHEWRLFQNLLEGEPMEAPSQRIIKPVELIKNNDNFVLILQDFQGSSTLRNFCVAKTSMNYEELINFMMQLAEALDIIHSMTVIHRDINPDNILIREKANGKFEVQIIDFNMARYNRPGQELSDLFKGTLAYMSPGISVIIYSLIH